MTNLKPIKIEEFAHYDGTLDDIPNSVWIETIQNHISNQYPLLTVLWVLDVPRNLGKINSTLVCLGARCREVMYLDIEINVVRAEESFI